MDCRPAERGEVPTLCGQHLDALNDVYRRRFESEQQLVDWGLEEAVRLTDSTIGYFHFVEPDLAGIQLFTWSKGALERCTAAAERHYPLAQAGIWADAARTRATVVHNDYPTTPHRRGLPEGHAPVTRHVSVPIIADDRVEAIMGVGNKAAPYEPNDVRLLELIAQGLWYKLVHGRSLRMLRESNAMLEAKVREHVAAVDRLEGERRTAERRLVDVRRLESLGALAGGIAHRFNNILAAIMMEADLVRLDQRVAAAHGSMETILASTRRAADLANKMVAYAGSGRVAMGEVDLAGVIRELTRSPWKRQDAVVTFELDVAADLPPIQGDRALVRQMFENLLENAAEATGAIGGCVHVVVRTTRLAPGSPVLLEQDEAPEPGDYAAVTVRDAGVGMSTETLRRAFDPFFSTKEFGRGLGLPMVRGTARSHRGFVRIESRTGRGTTATIYLPLGPPAFSHAAPGAAHTVRPSTHPNRQVLVVDDEDEYRQVLCRLLTHQRGLTVLEASGGRAGIALFRQHHAHLDCVVVDLTMPDVGGVETMWAMRAINPGVPIVLSTGFGASGALEHQSEFDGFLTKPTSAEALLAELDRVRRR